MTHMRLIALPFESLLHSCGVLKQELIIEYQGEGGQDAGGLLRQFFDLFTTELQSCGHWALTAAGGLCPADSAEAGGAPGAPLRAHMETCGRVCGMALYQELHRRRMAAHEMEALGRRVPSLFGAAFARHFVRLVQCDPPRSLAELQAELQAESLEAHPDYRAGPEILARSVAESGLCEQAREASTDLPWPSTDLPSPSTGLAWPPRPSTDLAWPP